MRRVQMAGAAMWIAYGAFMHAAPVVVANLLVLSAAAWTGTRAMKARRAGPSRGLGPRSPASARRTSYDKPSVPATATVGVVVSGPGMASTVALTAAGVGLEPDTGGIRG
jgi:hypothetical protein